MTFKSKPKNKYICYICEKERPIKDRGAILNSSGVLPDIICSKCVHENYCWATDKDLSEHNYTELEERKYSLLKSI